ncbi:MAG TPA: LamG-like jellyroll fold domain-containing protein [Solirubrobacteraceae bacterium]|nr:LamG-like jellyroll fold domain-containing protein [Solirubrobacteraceae bacterium]
MRRHVPRRAAALALVCLGVLLWSATARATQPYEGYETTVAADSPVAQFRFDDAKESTEVKDSAGSFTATNHGMELGSGSGPFAGAKAGKLEGSGYATLPGDPLAGDSEFTAEAWVNWGSGSQTQEPVFAFGSTTTNYMLLTPQSSISGNPLAFEIHPSSGSPAVIHTSAHLTPNHWEYVAVSETSGGTLKLYVDGNLVQTVEGATVSPASLGSTGLNEDFLGRVPLILGTKLFKGKLSNVAFYGKALSPERIKTHYDVTVPPENIEAPAISGAAKEGQLLTVSNGTWKGEAVHFAYKWERCEGASCTGISGANTPSFRVTSETVGKTIRASVIDETITGPATAHSAQTATVTTGPPVGVKAPSYVGVAVEHHELAASIGTWAGTASITYAHAWERCEGASCSTVSTATSYTPTSGDVGKSMRFSVTASNGVGETTVRVSAGTVGASSGASAIGWGENYWNQLGSRMKDNYEENHLPVEGVEGVRSVVLGGTSGYAVLENGTIASWGTDGHGQLGDGNEVQSLLKETSHVTVMEENSEKELVPFKGFKSISAANTHALALMNDGSVKAWGSNAYGEMGNGKGGFYYETKEVTDLPKAISALTPEALAAHSLPPVVAVQAVAGSDFAILENGEVLAWGQDTRGQLGIGEPGLGEEAEMCHTELGHERCSTIPRLVRLAGGEPLKNVAAISGSDSAAYALLTNGHVMAWGANNKGQLGRGVKSETSATKNIPPTEVVMAEGGAALTGVVSIDSGGGHALALRENGEVVGWGQSEEDALGNIHNQECGPGSKNEQHEKENEEKHEEPKHPCVKAATQIIAPGGLGAEKSPITEMSVGGQFNVLLDAAGEVYTWGQDKYSKLGDGGTTNNPTPTKITMPGPVRQIATGQSFAVAVLEAGDTVPPPLMSVSAGVGSYDLRWNFEASRLVYHVSKREILADPEEGSELTLNEEGPPEEEELPEITGSPEVATRLKASKGRWSGERPLTTTYQWQRCTFNEESEEETCVNITKKEKEEHEPGEGEQENLYKPGPADVGHLLRVVVTVKNGEPGSEASGTATSLPTEEVESESESMNDESKKVPGERDEPITQLRGAPLLEAPYEMHLSTEAGQSRMIRAKHL